VQTNSQHLATRGGQAVKAPNTQLVYKVLSRGRMSAFVPLSVALRYPRRKRVRPRVGKLFAFWSETEARHWANDILLEHFHIRSRIVRAEAMISAVPGCRRISRRTEITAKNLRLAWTKGESPLGPMAPLRLAGAVLCDWIKCLD